MTYNHYYTGIIKIKTMNIYRTNVAIKKGITSYSNLKIYILLIKLGFYSIPINVAHNKVTKEQIY